MVINCWEYKKCGREPGGKNAKEKGVCPAAISNDFNGVNKGKYAGRFCWAIAGTFCDEKKQGSYAMKLESCLSCDFLKLVNNNLDREFILTLSDAIEKKKKEKK